MESANLKRKKENNLSLKDVQSLQQKCYQFDKELNWVNESILNIATISQGSIEMIELIDVLLQSDVKDKKSVALMGVTDSSLPDQIM